MEHKGFDRYWFHGVSAGQGGKVEELWGTPGDGFGQGPDLREISVGRYTVMRRTVDVVNAGKRRYNTELVLGRAQVGYAELTRGGIREAIKREFGDVIQDKLEGLRTCPWVKHYIPLTDSSPVYKKPYRYPYAMREKIRAQLEEMLRAGIIRHSASPFSSSLWVVPKRDHGEGNLKFRVVVYYRDLNKKTEPEFYPLPRIEDLLDTLAGATIFSVIDLKSGYHQIEIAEEYKSKTAFTFERGHYEYNRMPFGLRNAPATFQRLMDAVLKPLWMGFVQGYTDDLIIFSKVQEGTLRSREGGVPETGHSASTSKSKIALESIDFLGYVITREGIAPARQKVQGILDAGIPQNPTEIRRVLGMINYYRWFIPNAAEVCNPLTAALQKNWNVKDVKVFGDALKQPTFCEGRVTYLTGIDALSKYALALQIPDKSGNSVRKALANWFAMFGVPLELVMDNGKEFRNKLVQGHFGTPEVVKRRGLVGPEAVLVTVAAYNSSVHSVTGVTPFEAIFGQTSLRPVRRRTVDAMNKEEREQVFQEIEERVEAEKAARVARVNEPISNDALANIRPWDVLYKAANLTRRKGDRRFDGPFLVRDVLDHGRL
ncbi:hypothetical protein AAG570_005305 [Ranatra chinensis]|uniref:Integrase catalytic domain-containing protein n=1 Tax=Ranatra chinensis TaxID=642074 RepID=A0ABD0Y1M3_9HEMI